MVWRGVLWLVVVAVCVTSESSDPVETFMESARQCGNSAGKLKGLLAPLINALTYGGVSINADKFVVNPSREESVLDRLGFLSGSNGSDDFLGGMSHRISEVRDTIVGASTDFFATLNQRFPVVGNLLSQEAVRLPLDRIGTTLSSYSPTPLAMVGGLAAGFLGLLVGSNLLAVPINFSSITAFFNDMLTGLDRGDTLELDEYHQAGVGQAEYYTNHLPADHPYVTYQEEYHNGRGATHNIANKLFQALRTYRQLQEE